MNDVSLAYQFLWNAQRQPEQVWLYLEPLADSPVNTRHLLAALRRQWSSPCVKLTLSSTNTGLLMDLLAQTPPDLAQVEVAERLLFDPAVTQQVLRAQQRGLQLVWRGEPGTRPRPDHSHSFAQTLLSLSAEDALHNLRLLRAQSTSGAPARASTGAFASHLLLDGVANAGLLNYFLDQQGASALMGWPCEEVMFAYRQTSAQPAWHALQSLLALIEDDAAIEDVACAMSQEPLLVYRLLRFVNSAGLGLKGEITALRHALMMLGLVRVKSWLQAQLPQASRDLNLHPIATLTVMRARFMTELLEAGAASELQDELALCGLLSQMDLLMGEPLQVVLQALALAPRVSAALLNHSGPYWPYLDLAISLESGQAQATQVACLRHGLDAESVNLALLRTISTPCTSPAAARGFFRPPEPARQSHPHAHPSLH